jgi:hypothetical protein
VREKCVAERDEGVAWAAELAGYVETEAERQELDPLLMVAVAYRESHFKSGDVCRVEIAAERIVSRTARDDGRESITMTYRADPTRTATVEVTVLAERADGTLEVDRCSAGEIGLFQLVATEARAGQVVPATGEELPRNARECRKRVLVPQVNVSLAAVALDAARTWQCQVEPTPEAVARCEADPWSWIGAYNTGRRSGAAWERYARYVSTSYETALDYACEKMPDAATCPADGTAGDALTEPSWTETPPGSADAPPRWSAPSCATASCRCASAAAWARRGCSKGRDRQARWTWEGRTN